MSRDSTAWDPVWDRIYQRRSWGKYPKEELIRFIARHYYGAPYRSTVRFLDVGCGFGSSACYLAREGFAVDAIDGSGVIINLLRARIVSENLNVALAVGDASALPYAPETFDCVVDICCIQHNSPNDGSQILNGIFERLKPGGRLFSMTASDAMWGNGLGTQVAEGTYRDISEGPFTESGIARFSTEAEIRQLYRRFGDLHIELSEYSVDNRRQKISHWVIDGVKN
jgi:2-polyprenyl-3-methyl-5-hydroxy-6-metoxy-1,4-benzoquinol methylase